MKPSSIAPVLLLMLGGLYAAASVVLTDENTIGQMCRFLAAGGFVFCFMRPRAGFFTWLLFCGYNDLLKRLLVAGGRVSRDDLRFVLAITPAMFGGIVAGLLVGGLLGSQRLEGRHWRFLMFGLLLMAAAAGIALKGSGGSDGVLQALANNGLYSLLLFVVPVMFKNRDQLGGLWRFLSFGFLPVAVYGVVQQIWGFADFEIEYLLTGLSIEIKQLMFGEVRPFSTLNSPTALSVVCGLLCAICMISPRLRREDGRSPLMSRSAAVVCAIIYLAGLVASTGRSPFLLPPAIAAGAWCFISPSRTKVFYSLISVSFLALVLSSEWLMSRLGEFNDATISLASSNGFMSRMLVVATYSDRLSGFANVLMNPAAWSLFGYGDAGAEGESIYLYHDPVSEILMRYGAVTLFIVLVAGILALRWMHRQAWKMPHAEDRRMAVAMTALAFSLLLLSTLSGSVMTIFPVNAFFWLACAVNLGLSDRQAAPQPAVDPAPLQAALPRQVYPLRHGHNPAFSQMR